jgi:hypothetical protein
VATTEAEVLTAIDTTIQGLGYTRSIVEDFTKSTNAGIDSEFSVAFIGHAPIAQMGYYEEMRGTLKIRWVRQTNGDQHAAKLQLADDARDIISAVVRAGTSDGYAVEDARQYEVEFPKETTFGRAELSVPINFEVEL